MRTRISSIHFKATDSLKDFSETEVQRLARLSDDILDCEVQFSFTKTEKDAHIKVSVNGSQLNASGSTDDFKKSIVVAVDKLEQQIRKLKGKQQAAKRPVSE